MSNSKEKFAHYGTLVNGANKSEGNERQTISN